MSGSSRCIVISAGLNIAPARLALIDADVNDGDYIILVGSSVDVLNALAEFARRFTRTLTSRSSPLSLTKGLT